MLQQLQDKEQQLEADKRSLETKAEVLAQLFLQRMQRHERAEVTVGDLELWHRQAEAIDRSPTHLRKIDQILAVAREKAGNKSALPTVEIPVRDYGAMIRDRSEFNELAFRLIVERKEDSTSSNGSPDFLTSFWNSS